MTKCTEESQNEITASTLEIEFVDCGETIKQEIKEESETEDEINPLDDSLAMKSENRDDIVEFGENYLESKTQSIYRDHIKHEINGEMQETEESVDLISTKEVEEYLQKPGNDEPYVCPYPKCKYVSNRRSNVRRHLVAMHEKINTPYVCCGLSFDRKADLRHHNIEKHPQGVGYRCEWPECDKSFERKALLERHIKTHTQEKLYKCPHDGCNYGTSQKFNLQRHVKVHCMDTFMNIEQDS